jgi:hypothetical protein
MLKRFMEASFSDVQSDTPVVRRHRLSQNELREGAQQDVNQIK